MLGVELVLVGERDADLLGVQERQDLALVGEVRAGGIAEGIAAAAIALLQQRLDVARLVGGEAQLGADALVGLFGHRLRHLHRKPVEIEIILIAVLAEPFARHLGGARPHGDDLKPDHVALIVGDVAEEIGD